MEENTLFNNNNIVCNIFLDVKTFCFIIRDLEIQEISTKVEIKEITIWTKLSVGRESKRKVVARYVNCKNGSKPNISLLQRSCEGQSRRYLFWRRQNLISLLSCFDAKRGQMSFHENEFAIEFPLQYAPAEPCSKKKSYSWLSTDSALAKKLIVK